MIEISKELLSEVFDSYYDKSVKIKLLETYEVEL